MFITKKEKAKYVDEIATLKHEVAELKNIVKTQELIKLRNENARLKEKEQLISKIKFRLKDIAYLVEENEILAKYDVPALKISFNYDGKINKNDMFYAINKLQLISLEDMKKIQALIDQVTKQNQQK